MSSVILEYCSRSAVILASKVYNCSDDNLIYDYFIRLFVLIVITHVDIIINNNYAKASNHQYRS